MRKGASAFLPFLIVCFPSIVATVIEVSFVNRPFHRGIDFAANAGIKRKKRERGRAEEGAVKPVSFFTSL